MLSVTYKPLMPSVVMLNVIMLTVFMLSVVAPKLGPSLIFSSKDGASPSGAPMGFSSKDKHNTLISLQLANGPNKPER
jgi:hypothetical protein